MIDYIQTVLYVYEIVGNISIEGKIKFGFIFIYWYKAKLEIVPSFLASLRTQVWGTY